MLIESIKYFKNRIDRGIAVKEWRAETLPGPPKGIAPGLRPAEIVGGDWTCRMMNEPGGSLESGAGDRTFRLSRAHLKAYMLSSLPSTATMTRPRFSGMIDRGNGVSGC